MPMIALSPMPIATLALLTVTCGMKPPVGTKLGFTSKRARMAPMIPPASAISRPSPAIRKKMVTDWKPSVRMTAISVVRSRTDIAIVLPATNRVVITTASAMLPSRKLMLPNIDTNVA